MKTYSSQIIPRQRSYPARLSPSCVRMPKHSQWDSRRKPTSTKAPYNSKRQNKTSSACSWQFYKKTIQMSWLVTGLTTLTTVSYSIACEKGKLRVGTELGGFEGANGRKI